MEYTVSIETETVAFRDDQIETEIARLLREIADNVETSSGVIRPIELFDSNGESVGHAKWIEATA